MKDYFKPQTTLCELNAANALQSSPGTSLPFNPSQGTGEQLSRGKNGWTSDDWSSSDAE